jgi:hypothetical protein
MSTQYSKIHHQYALFPFNIIMGTQHALFRLSIFSTQAAVQYWVYCNVLWQGQHERVNSLRYWPGTIQTSDDETLSPPYSCWYYLITVEREGTLFASLINGIHTEEIYLGLSVLHKYSNIIVLLTVGMPPTVGLNTVLYSTVRSTVQYSTVQYCGGVPCYIGRLPLSSICRLTPPQKDTKNYCTALSTQRNATRMNHQPQPGWEWCGEPPHTSSWVA